MQLPKPPTSPVWRFARLSPARLRSALRAPAPTRPTVVIESDDWGRCGAPSPEALAQLRERGIPVGGSHWDFYGLESEDDVLCLADTLAGRCDRDGRPTCLTANFIMANADLPAMRNERFQSFRWVPIRDGFPAPWPDLLVPAYRAAIDRAVFYPGLHGFTHFNPTEMLRCAQEETARGERVRAVLSCDVPYLATATPEFNFALVSRREGERFAAEAEQADWVARGVALFRETFGLTPRTTCAPGYRANDVSFRQWRLAGIDAAQQVSAEPLSIRDGLLVISRNVFFEPIFDGDAVPRALRQARHAVARGLPIVVCTHSINYIDRHVGRAKASRQALSRFLDALIEAFPELRFASDGDLVKAVRGGHAGWLRRPTPSEVAARLRALRARSGGTAAAPQEAAS